MVHTKERDFLTPQLRFHVCTNGETSIVLTVTSTCSDAGGSEAADMATAKRTATHTTILSGTILCEVAQNYLARFQRMKHSEASLLKR